jgi:diphosphomevalonate decarboxylase
MNMTKQQIVNNLLREIKVPTKDSASAFAPTNIALCKYWGKRNTELNLPVTSSISISLANLGACTRVSLMEGVTDQVTLNKQVVAQNTVFYRRMVEFLDLFRPTADTVFNINTNSNIPIAAGLASSACGFAAIVKALNELFNWHLNLEQLSILARLGSGSACRSMWHGFVQWDAGIKDDGMDSYARLLDYHWPELRVGLLLVDERQKLVSSREAMQASVDTSPFYSLWPQTVAEAISDTHKALVDKDFWALGTIAEANALAMHSLMLSTTPAIIYSQATTLDYMRQIWRARAEGLSVFFTQDAGPNLKLFFLDKDEAKIRELFSEIEIVAPFATLEQTVECHYDY